MVAWREKASVAIVGRKSIRVLERMLRRQVVWFAGSHERVAADAFNRGALELIDTYQKKPSFHCLSCAAMLTPTTAILPTQA